jgi:hypothetical protein
MTEFRADNSCSRATPRRLLAASVLVVDHEAMSSPSGTLMWRLPRSLRVFADLGAALGVAVGLVFGVGSGLQLSFITSWVDQPGSHASNLLWGIFVIAASLATVIWLRRVVLVLSDDSLFIQNMFRSYRIPLAEIVRVSTIPSGVYVEYLQDGRHQWRVAMASQGIKNAWVFKNSRVQTIADIISARLPAAPAESHHPSRG